MTTNTSDKRVIKVVNVVDIGDSLGSPKNKLFKNTKLILDKKANAMERMNFQFKKSLIITDKLCKLPDIKFLFPNKTIEPDDAMQ